MSKVNHEIELILESFLYMLQHDEKYQNILDINHVKLLFQQSQQQVQQSQQIFKLPEFKHFAKIKARELQILNPDQKDLNVLLLHEWNQLSEQVRQLYQRQQKIATITTETEPASKKKKNKQNASSS